jgi:hypothetical protein
VRSNLLLAWGPYNATRTAAAGRRNPAAARSGAARSGTAWRKSWITKSRGTTPTASSRHTGLRLPASTSRATPIDVGEHELPFVVPGASLVHSDRFLFTFAHDADNSSGTRLSPRGTAAEARAWSGNPRRGIGTLFRASRSTCRTPRTWVRASKEWLKLAVLRHGILVFLAEVTSLDEHLDARRKGPILELVEANGSRVLLAPEFELQLFLALRLKAPCRKGRGHQDRHHGKRDQQSGHRVAAISVLTP